MGIASRAAEARPTETIIRCCAPWDYIEVQVQAIASMDTLVQGRAKLLATMPRDEQGQVQLGDMTPEQLTAARKACEVAICAGVIGSRRVGEEGFEPDRFVMHRGDARPGQAAWVGIIPDPVKLFLGFAIISWAMSAGEVAEALATFRPGRDGDGGSTGAPVRAKPRRGAAVDAR